MMKQPEAKSPTSLEHPYKLAAASQPAAGRWAAAGAAITCEQLLNRCRERAWQQLFAAATTSTSAAITRLASKALEGVCCHACRRRYLLKARQERSCMGCGWERRSRVLDCMFATDAAICRLPRSLPNPAGGEYAIVPQACLVAAKMLRLCL